MGLLLLLNGEEVPFPRRLFGALARAGREVSGRAAEWDELEGKWLGWGCYLVLSEMPHADLVLMRQAIGPLMVSIEANEELDDEERAGWLSLLGKVMATFPGSPPH